MLRIGIAGTGWMGSSRAKVLAATEDVKVVGALTRTAEKAANMGVAAFTDYAQMLDVVDAVVVCLPNAVHSEYALKALKAGKHVLVEYPLCTTVAQIDPLRQVAQVNNLVLMVGNTIEHEPMFKYVQAARPHLGQILSAASRVAAYDPGLASSWFLNPNITGPVFAALHYHHIEYYRRFIGDVTHITALDQCDSTSIIGGVMSMTHNTRAISTIHWHLIATPPAPGNNEAHVPRCMWLNGTDDSLTIVENNGKSNAIWGHGGDGRVDVFDNDDWGLSDSTQEFITAIRGEFDHIARLDSDIATLQVGLRAAEAARK